MQFSQGALEKARNKDFCSREEQLSTNVLAFQRVDLPVSTVMGSNRDGWNRKQSMGGRLFPSVSGI